MLVVIADDVSGAAAAPAAEGYQTGRRNPLHGAVLYLVSDGSPGPLVAQKRSLKIPLLLLLDYPVDPPSPLCVNSVPSVPWQ